tara:strand:- start:122 stop:862 length:741 start_codon:yes stop_codon:yes gene_type:complete
MVNINLNVINSCVSTNEIAFNAALNGAKEGNSYLSYNQTKGRGRNSNEWISIKGNLFLSTIIRPNKKKSYWNQLSIIVGFSALEVFCELGVDKNIIEMKWPNDILVDKKKISGILLESSDNFIVAGIGANILKNPTKEKKWDTARLIDYINFTASIEDIGLKILDKVFNNYIVWENFGLKAFINKVNPFIKNINCMICVKLSSQSDYINGIFLGLGDDGGLKIKQNKEVLEFYSIDNFYFPERNSI